MGKQTEPHEKSRMFRDAETPGNETRERNFLLSDFCYIYFFFNANQNPIKTINVTGTRDCAARREPCFSDVLKLHSCSEFLRRFVVNVESLRHQTRKRSHNVFHNFTPTKEKHKSFHPSTWQQRAMAASDHWGRHSESLSAEQTSDL